MTSISQTPMGRGICSTLRGVLLVSWALVTVTAAAEPAPATAKKEPQQLPPLDDGWKPLALDANKRLVWIHPTKKQVAVDGHVCLTRGYLEMFACIENTKEHEAVVALKSKAFAIHAALLAVGAKPGAPANWRPAYQPAHGTKIEVWVAWMQDGKVRRTKAQEWIRDLKTKKAMRHDWVFGGSSFWKDPETGKSHYRAEGGDLICVSNFPTAMLDLPIKSSQANDELVFEALTENIPARNTPIRLYLVPKRAKSPDKKGATPAGTARKAETAN